MKLRCLVVEDQLMFLELLVVTLQTVPHIEVVATASSVQEGLLAVERHKPDLGIFDLVLPGGNGLLLAQKAKELAPGIECILLTAQPGRIARSPEIGTCFRAIVDKVRAFDVLLREVDAVLREKFPSLKNPALTDPGLLLTPREFEVFQLVGQGLGNKQIAAGLFISLRTVESHRKAISRKLKSSGAELVRAAALYRHRPPS
ncbi:MAG: response regulator transcription factor [Verrucomicrobiae bacterium]